MFPMLVNSEGGLTTAGYVTCIVLGVILFLLGSVFARKDTQNVNDNGSKAKKSIGMAVGTNQLVFCAMAIALAVVTSYVKIFSLPWGGSVTLCSMLFIVLVANWYGVQTGILVGLTYGILQFIQEPYVLSFFQVCCDYILAFAALGVAGFFAKSSNGLISSKLNGR